MKLFQKIILPIISVAIFIFALFIAALLIDDGLIFPSPTSVFKEFFVLLKSESFYREVILDLWRTTYSFFFSLVLSVIFAVITSLNDALKTLFYPVVASIRAVPTIAIILWCLIIFKSDVAPAAISFIVTFPMVYNEISAAIFSRDKKIDEMAKIYGIKKSDYIFRIIVPDISERCFPQVCSLFSFNVKLIVAGEALSYTKLSIGRELQLANINMETAKLLAFSVAVILMSVLAEVFLKALWKLIKGGIYGYNRKRIIEKIR
ncbi:MAG: ABC transporter permease subunit [Clostridia bacterium]|nr:ABC transporter permease subunit [Clostridia bacterium]